MPAEVQHLLVSIACDTLHYDVSQHLGKSLKVSKREDNTRFTIGILYPL